MMRAGVGALVAVVLAAQLAGCSRGGDDTCEGLESYRGVGGAPLVLMVAKNEDQNLQAALAPFRSCTGIEVRFMNPAPGRSVADEMDHRSGSNDFDLALVGHPQFRSLTARSGALTRVPDTAAAQLDQNFNPSWAPLMSARGEVYGIPVDLEMKSLVWYSPASLRAKNASVPQSWQEMKSTTAALASRASSPEVKPWCEGFALPGATSGWPGTDWIEDLVLRTSGPAVFDRWVDHRVPFDDSRIGTATQEVSDILLNPRYTNGGLGTPAQIGETPFTDAGRSVLSGQCFFHRQSNTATWPDGTRVDPNGDVWAFPLPAMRNSATHPILGAGNIAVGFNTKRTTQALQTYFATTRFAQSRAAAAGSTGWVSANRAMDNDAFRNPLDRQVSAWLQDDRAVFRYDGSDDMPPPISNRVFWREIMRWIEGEPYQVMLRRVQFEWPR